MSNDKDLQGKVYVVTGANSGIGFVAARDFARRGAELVMVCRDAERGQRAREDIQSATGSQSLHLLLADFSLLASVNNLADELLARFPAVHVLCNNAGGANGSRQVTAEGFERTFVTNHLSAFLLTSRLLPALRQAAVDEPSRVVFTASYGHNHSPLDFNDLNLEEGYTTLKAYGRSKLMNVLTARELQRRHAEEGIVASSFHPGAVRTAIWRKGGTLARLMGLAMYPFMRSEEKGAETLIWLAASGAEEARQPGGDYFQDRHKAGVAAFVTDESARRLWEVSEELVQPYLQQKAETDVERPLE
ncbi:MAG: SDR family oxidoreductase [Pseudohongiellaceae bacterium]